MACAAWPRLLDSPVFRPRSTRCLQPCYRKRCVPNRGKSPLQAAKMQNSDASTAQSNPMPSVPFPQDYLRGDRESPPEKVVPRREELFDRRVYASRAPDLDTTHRVLSRGLEVAQKVQ